MPAADRSRWANSRAPDLDPWREQDACGVGFVARASGHRSVDIARLALQALARVAHRGAAATDRSGDGAGLLTQIPTPLFYREAASRGLALAAGQPFAVGAFFLPREQDALGCTTTIIEDVLRGEGFSVVGVCFVQVDLDVLGAGARASCPTIRQAILGPAAERGRFDETTWERSLYLARRTIERRIGDAGPGLEPFFVCSLSCRTLVYKALLTGTQLAGFFPDLASSDYETALAIFHQRYSTNTTSSWPLAQPFRMLAHNGEINTLWGNRNAMAAREPVLAAPVWSDAVDRLTPIIWSEGSDSASLDNALELLVRSGRDPVHALMMLVPEAHEGAVEMEPALRGFYEFHECLVEPWDGPAALAFSDGVFVGSALDRNGLRPCRYKITRDGLVVAGSESGLVDLNPADVVESGRLGPGELLVVDTRRKAILRNGEAKREVARRRPYSRWAARGIRLLRPTAAVPDAPPTPEPERVARQVAFGWSFEDLRYVLEPMGSAGHDAVWSMGDDTPIPPLARIPPGLYAYLRQRFAQVTNPAIDPLRETLVMTLRMHIGRRGSLLADRPAGLRLVRNEHPVLLAEEIAALRTGAGAQVVTLDTTWSASAGAVGGGGPDALRTALDGLCRSAGNAVREGARIVILSDRAAGRERAPLPMLLAVGAVHQHLLEHGLRTRLGLIAEAGDAWDVHHFAALMGYGAEAVHPWLALESVQVQVAEDDARLRFRAAAEAGLLKILSKMGISTLSSYCGAQIFEALGLGAEVIDRCFTGTVSTIGGIGFTEIAEDVLARHRAAYPDVAAAEPVLPDHGRVRYRRDGEDHGWSPQLVRSMQAAVKADTPQAYDAFRARVAARLPASPRDLLAFRAVAPRPLEFGRGRRRPRHVRAARERRPRGQPHQAGRLRAVRGHDALSDACGRARDQDCAGLEARRRGPAPRSQGHGLDRAVAPLGTGRAADLAAAAPRHLFDRGPGAAHPRSEAGQPARAGRREAGGGSGRGAGRRRRRQGLCRLRARLRPQRRDGRLTAVVDQARRIAVGAGARGNPGDPHREWPAPPHRGANGRRAAHGARRRHRRAARRRELRVRHRGARRDRVRHGPAVPPQHLPHRHRDSEAGAAGEVSRHPGAGGRLLHLDRGGRPPHPGGTGLPLHGRRHRPGGPAGARGPPRSAPRADARPVAAPDRSPDGTRGAAAPHGTAQRSPGRRVPGR